MTKYIVRRAIGLLPLLLGTVLLSFTLMKLAPGGPQTQFQGNKKISQEQIDTWLKRWCLSRETTPLSVVKEFGGWFGILNCNRDAFPDAFFSDTGGLNFLPTVLGGGTNGIVHGDLGYSVSSGRTVTLRSTRWLCGHSGVGSSPILPGDHCRITSTNILGKPNPL